MRKAASVLGIATILSLSGFSLAAGTAAAAASCKSIVVTGAPAGKALIVAPATVSVPVHGCVSVLNSAVATLAVSVSGASASPTTANLSLAGSSTFTFGSTGTAHITVAGTLLVLKSTATGTVTVTPAPAATTSPAASPKPTHQAASAGGSSGRTASKPGSKPAGHPRVGSGSKGSTGKHSSPKPATILLPTLPPLPALPPNVSSGRSIGTAPLVAGLPGAAAPVVVPLPSSGAATPAKPTQVTLADSSQQVASQHRALPEAIAILIILALSAGYGRAVLSSSSAVDNGSVGPSEL